jgi:hypothetical protein
MGLPHSALICVSAIFPTIITTPSLHIFANSECGLQVLCNSERWKMFTFGTYLRMGHYIDVLLFIFVTCSTVI